MLERIDLKTAQTRLGHADPRLTPAVYAQATKEADRDAGERLGVRFRPPESTTAHTTAESDRGINTGCTQNGPDTEDRKPPLTWSGRRDLNPRPQRPERCALTKLRYFPLPEMVSDEGWTRTGCGRYESS